MHIAVCVKEIINPEIHPGLLRIDEVARRVVAPVDLSSVMSPFDEQALEAALRIRDGVSDVTSVRITAVCLGEASSKRILKHALALGADAAVLLSDHALADSDSHGTALALARVISRLADVDLVLAGRQAADTDAGIVALSIAELLGVPAITLAKEVTIGDGGVRVVRALGDLTETVEAPLPTVITIAHELGAVRKPTLRETMRAAKKPMATWDLEDVGLEANTVGSMGARRRLEHLYRPVRDSQCEMIPGDSAAALAAALVRRLVEERIL